MDSQASEYVSLASKAASISSRFFTVGISRNVCDSRELRCFQPEETQRIQKVLAQSPVTTPVFLFFSDNGALAFAAPGADWLQVHAVYEIIGLLCGEGPGFLQLVTDKLETTADHEQQQSGDDEAESQRKDRTYRRKGKAV